MRKGRICAYCHNDSNAKISLALGCGIRAVKENLKAVIIGFKDEYNEIEKELMETFDPNLRIFFFSKQQYKENLSKEDIELEIKQGFNFANKVIDTGECELLILDGILDAVEKGFVKASELQEMLARKDEYMEVIIAGRKLDKELEGMVSHIYQLQKLK